MRFNLHINIYVWYMSSNITHRAMHEEETEGRGQMRRYFCILIFLERFSLILQH